jgi:hypothetical protein
MENYKNLANQIYNLDLPKYYEEGLLLFILFLLFQQPKWF